MKWIRKEKLSKQMRKCFPQLLKLLIFLFSMRWISSFELPLTSVILSPVKGVTSSRRMTMDGPSGMGFLRSCVSGVQKIKQSTE